MFDCLKKDHDMKYLNQLIENYPQLILYVKVLSLALICYILYLIANKIFIKMIQNWTQKTKSQLDDIIFAKPILKKVSLLIIINIAYYLSRFIPELDHSIQKTCTFLTIVIVIFLFNSVLTLLNTIYEKTKKFENRPIKGYIQSIKIIINFFGLLILISFITNRSPWSLITALGAITAILLLIFKDTILSLVASFQITWYDLIKVGDWIEVPQYHADGDVIDISLHTVKIQNFDKTISVIPTYKLIDSSFKNWRGMSLSGGRRIKRAIHIDQNSIKFCDQLMIDQFMDFKVLSTYIEKKIDDISQFNQNKGLKPEDVPSGRKLTNLGTFRAYLKEYLKSRNDINHSMTFLIRQLSPGPHGIPIEIYIFTNTTDWIRYEEIQADIFDHILAVIPLFHLKVFQFPSGEIRFPETK